MYVAYNDDQGSNYQLHLVLSKDKGATWSGDLQTIANALNAALALNIDGRVAMLYQQLVGSGAAQTWVTQCKSSIDGISWQTVTLASTPSRRRSHSTTFSPPISSTVELSRRTGWAMPAWRESLRRRLASH